MLAKIGHNWTALGGTNLTSVKYWKTLPNFAKNRVVFVKKDVFVTSEDRFCLNDRGARTASQLAKIGSPPVTHVLKKPRVFSKSASEESFLFPLV